MHKPFCFITDLVVCAIDMEKLNVQSVYNNILNVAKKKPTSNINSLYHGT
jgi:hypothetical protein